MRAIGGAILLILLAAAAAAAPWLVSEYALALLIDTLCYIVLATAWSLFSGPLGLVSLATAAFFGIGAYSVAILIDIVPFYVAFAAALTAGIVVSYAIGVATLRLSGMYFVVFGFGLSELIRQLITWWEIEHNQNVGRYVLVDYGDSWTYEQLLALAILVFLVGWLLRRSRLGFAARVIGGDEIAARQVGINAPAVKVIVFMVSATLITAAGAVMAPHWTYIAPTLAFNPIISFEVVIMAFLGGVQRLWGPALGVIPLIALSQILSVTFPYLFSILLGVVFLAVVLAVPRGLTSLLEEGFAFLRSNAFHKRRITP